MIDFFKEAHIVCVLLLKGPQSTGAWRENQLFVRKMSLHRSSFVPCNTVAMSGCPHGVHVISGVEDG